MHRHRDPERRPRSGGAVTRHRPGHDAGGGRERDLHRDDDPRARPDLRGLPPHRRHHLHARAAEGDDRQPHLLLAGRGLRRRRRLRGQDLRRPGQPQARRGNGEPIDWAYKPGADGFAELWDGESLGRLDEHVGTGHDRAQLPDEPGDGRRRDERQPGRALLLAAPVQGLRALAWTTGRRRPTTTAASSCASRRPRPVADIDRGGYQVAILDNGAADDAHPARSRRSAARRRRSPPPRRRRRSTSRPASGTR